jgi:hypothetical protein
LTAGPDALYTTSTLREAQSLSWWWPTGQRCKLPQVLGDGGKDKFILCASWATQSKSTKVPVREEKGPLPHISPLRPIYFTVTTKRGLQGRTLLVSKFQDRNSLLHIRAETEEAGNNQSRAEL